MASYVGKSCHEIDSCHSLAKQPFVATSETTVAPYVVADVERLYEFRDRALAEGAFAFDVESTGEHRGIPQVNDVTWLSLATEGKTIVVPMGHPNGNRVITKARRYKNKDTGEWVQVPAVFSPPPEQLGPVTVFSALNRLFFSPDVIKVAHNATFDLLSVAKYLGEPPCPPYGDTMVAGWLLDENRLKGLKPLVKARYGLDYDQENVGKAVEKHEFWKVARYAWLDAKMTWLLWKYFLPLLAADPKLWSVWELECNLIPSLLDMGVGMTVDVSAMEDLRTELSDRLIGVEKNVYKAAGTIFSLGSVPQKQQVLYGPNGAGLKPSKLTPGGLKKSRAGSALTLSDYSTDDEALKEHRGHPLVDSILEYQEVAKIKQTYLDGILGTEKKPAIVFDGKVYAKFNQTGCVTGRFSSNSPNLQNIPARGDVGKLIRDSYIAPDGHVLIIADYAQIELRILAHYCRDGKLYEGFINGIDAHTATASALFHVAPEDVTPFMRQVAKQLNFAIVYGAGVDLVAAKANISTREAEKFFKFHEVEFPEIYDFKERLLTEALKRPVPHVRSLMGRCRRLPDLRSPIYKKRKAAERQLCNFICQGTNADLTKLAMVRFHQRKPAEAHMHMTVHDELVASIPAQQAAAGVEALEWAMTGPGIQELLRVPILADVKVCSKWSEGKG